MLDWRSSRLSIIVISVVVMLCLGAGLAIAVVARDGASSQAPTRVVYVDLAATPTIARSPEATSAVIAIVTIPPTDLPIAVPSPFPTAIPTGIPSPTPTPTLLSTDTPVPCELAPASVYVGIWQQHRADLGCATSGLNANVTIAQEHFEHGMMTWHKPSDRITVHYDTGGWVSYQNTWWEGDETFSCGTPQSPPTPLRGFGRVWCTHEDVRTALGNATAAEVGQTAKQQDFQGGTILESQFGDIYVFLNSGTWWVH